MKFMISLVIFVVLGLLGASTIIKYGFFFNLEAFHFEQGNSILRIHSSWYEYVLIGSFLLPFFVWVASSDGDEPILPVELGLAISLMTIAAFWVSLRLGWLLLGHGSLMSTGSAGLLVPGRIDNTIWIYFNLIGNLLLVFAGLEVINGHDLLGSLAVIGLYNPSHLARWPMVILTVIIIVTTTILLGIGIKKGFGLIGKLAGLLEGEKEDD